MHALPRTGKKKLRECCGGVHVTASLSYFQNGQPIAMIDEPRRVFGFTRLELLPNPSGREIATQLDVFLRMREHISRLASSAFPRGGADATLC